ncbi:MAG TPA: TonB-dependent receptor [Terriglobales bacterium]|nr:TonB-dependent receptor [Terriglobales bacterium]
MFRYLHSFFLVILLVGLMGSVLAYGQVDYATATLKGVVVDPQGAVVAGVNVSATNSRTGIVKSAQTDSQGRYQIPALPPGAYEISFAKQGFSKEVVKDVVLTVGQTLVYDAHLKPGTSETVEVTGENVELIQTEQTQQANTINDRQVEYLPNIDRNFTNNVYTVPGVSNSEATRSQTPGFTPYLTTGFSIGGSNGRNNLSTIDGGENEYGTGQYRITNYPVDAIQEYQINRNAFNAEFGFTDGSAINIVTRTGGNRFHGDVHGFFRNQDTSAANFFNGFQGRPKAFSQNLYAGGTFGGPIVKDKLFFFMAYEFQRQDTPIFNVLLNTPQAQGISATGIGLGTNCAGPTPTTLNPNLDQLCYINALKTSGNPFLVGFANGVTPGLTPTNNPSLVKLLTRDDGIFSNPDRLHNATARLDYQAGTKDSLSFRLTYAHNNFRAPQQGIVNGSPDGEALFARDFSALGTWTHAFGDNLVNQALVQVVPRNRFEELPLNPGLGVRVNLGVLGPVGSPALVPYRGHQQRYQFEDNLTLSKGAHTFKIGASYRAANYHVENDLWFNPQFDFRDSVIPLINLAPPAVQAQLVGFNLSHGLPSTGAASTNLSGAQSFAFGIPADMLAGFNNPVWQGWGHYFGAYAQDTWKLNSRLTMNAGVRFDVDGEPSPLSTSFYASPRLGFAWDPFGDHKTVFRAAGGIYYAPVDVLIPIYGSLLNGSGRYINEVVSVLSPTDPTVAKLWQLGVAQGNLPFGQPTAAQYAAVGINTNAPGASVGYSVTSNYKNPYTVQASFSFDHELAKNLSLEIGYNMYRGIHLQMPLETAYTEIPVGSPLCPPPSVTIFAGCHDQSGGPLYAPVTGQLQHVTYSSIGNSIYHGMTTSLTKRYSNGLQFQVNYTWSKTIDDVIDFSSFQAWFRPSRLSTYRATSVFDVPHIFVANAVYTTPFKANEGNWFTRALADISLAPIVTVRSGLPFSVRTPSLVNKINNQTLDNNFAIPFGARRDNNRGAAYATTDMRFTKAVFFNRDRGIRVDFIVEGTNIFNRTNFNQVNDVFDVNGFTSTVALANGQTLNLLTGPYTGLHGVKPHSIKDLKTPLSFIQADAARQIQFGIKIAF